MHHYPNGASFRTRDQQFEIYQNGYSSNRMLAQTAYRKSPCAATLFGQETMVKINTDYVEAAGTLVP